MFLLKGLSITGPDLHEMEGRADYAISGLEKWGVSCIGTQHQAIKSVVLKQHPMCPKYHFLKFNGNNK